MSEEERMKRIDDLMGTDEAIASPDRYMILPSGGSCLCARCGAIVGTANFAIRAHERCCK